MPTDFWSPSYRASSSDLTVAISPLGLVELADEEFEVHGPRLNRYAACWAWYLGHHHSQRREMGDQNITLNYTRTLSDYITNFTFGKGVQFRTPEFTASIIPRLLAKVWEEDNDKGHILWEMGQLAGVTGDCFVKVAYEEPWEDSIGVYHEGQTRIIPLNPAHCFPEYHPHDRTRLLRFKLKYRFWGTSPEGTRQVYTFTEILTDDNIEQYVNDELIDTYANPIGTVPVVHIPNTTISSSPWGNADIWDIIPLNRELNEKMTEISDIINYHAAPVTVITGAKASQLERGAKKMWAGLPKDAKVFNLQGGGEMASAMEYVGVIKQAMHELTGVPESALGQTQPISNTSGTALSMMYLPMINKYTMKKIHFSRGLVRVNELIIRTVAVHEPDKLQYSAWNSAEPEPDHALILDPRDPITYKTSIHWPDPLPTDVLVTLNEEQAKMALGLQSKEGAMAKLGEDFPNEKLAEVFEEIKADTIRQGALSLLEAQTTAAIYSLTGVYSGGGTASSSSVTTSADAGEQGVLPGPVADPVIMDKLATQAFGTTLAQRRVPSTDD